MLKKDIFQVALTMAAFLGLSSQGFAADMAVKAPVAPAVSALSWTGVYLGFGGGYVSASGTAWDPPPNNWSDGTPKPQGGLFGLQGGADYQFVNNVVVGIQGDYYWASASNTVNNPTTAGFTQTGKVKSIGTVTGRLGYAWSSNLLYVKGGYSWAAVSESYTNTAGTASGNADFTSSGYVLGIGDEYRLTKNVSIFGEYNYHYHSNKSFTYKNQAGTAVAGELRDPYAHVFKAGLNFRM